MKIELSLEQIEANLDHGALRAPMRTSANGYSLWQVRRNGKTRRWKRDPMRFEIPVKIGFRLCKTITNTTTFGTGEFTHPYWFDYKVIPQNV